MKTIIQQKKLLYTIAMCVVILTVYFTYIGIKNHLWARYQESVTITPEQVVDIFKDAGYEISNIMSIDGERNPFIITDDGIDFDIVVDGVIYGTTISCTDGWRTARSAAKNSNRIDELFSGGFLYSFSYGSVLVNIYPENIDRDQGIIAYKNAGEELYNVLNKEYRENFRKGE